MFGSLTKVMVSGVVIAIFTVAVGLTPAAYFTKFLSSPPWWIESIWFRVGLVIVGLAAIGIILWNGQQRAQPKITADDISYGLVVGSPTFAHEAVKRGKRVVQAGVQIQNRTSILMRYHVDAMSVTWNGLSIDNPAFSNRGTVLRPLEETIFRFPAFKDAPAVSDNVATVSIEVSYGPLHGNLRQVKRSYDIAIKFSGKQMLPPAWTIAAETDEPL